MKFKVFKDAWLPMGAGLTLYPFVFIDSKNPVKTFKHECCHCYQIKSMGVISFYLTWFWQFLQTRSITKGELEQEAYAYDDHPLTDEEWEWYQNGYIILE